MSRVYFWTPEREAALRKAVADTRDDLEAAAVLSKRLGVSITRAAVSSQRGKLGIPARIFELANTVRRDRSAPRELPPLDYEEDAETVPAAASAVARDTEPPADRTYVDRPIAARSYPPLDVGSSDLERVLLVPDTHRPFHDRRAWDVMLKAARAFRPHTIVQLGDFADMYTVSDHDRDPRRATQLSAEADDVNEGFDELDALGAERKIFTEGNHCDRLSRHLMRNSPALLNVVSVRALFKLDERGWNYIPYRSHARIAKLYVTHEVGHAGIHAVHHTAQAFQHNVAFGHTHRLGVTYFGSVTKERHVAASLGWLGDADEAKYAHEAKKAAWQLGFGVAHIERDGTVHLKPVPIVDYRVVMDLSATVIR